MEWLLIAVVSWRDPGVGYTRFATETECRKAGEITRAVAKIGGNRLNFECMPVAPLSSGKP